MRVRFFKLASGSYVRLRYVTAVRVIAKSRRGIGADWRVVIELRGSGHATDSWDWGTREIAQKRADALVAEMDEAM